MSIIKIIRIDKHHIKNHIILIDEMMTRKISSDWWRENDLSLIKVKEKIVF